MVSIAGDHEDRPYDAMIDIDRIAKDDLPATHSFDITSLSRRAVKLML
jgi:hypothetical protein